MNTFSLCLRATTLVAVTVVVLGGTSVLAQKGYPGYRPVYVLERDPLPSPTGEVVFQINSPTSDRLREALLQAQAALQASPPRYAEAEQAYRVALGANRKDFRAHFGLGYVYATQKRYAEALEPYKRAIEIGPRMPEAHFNLALVYLGLHNKEAALKQLNVLKKLRPDLANMIEQQINK